MKDPTRARRIEKVLAESGAESRETERVLRETRVTIDRLVPELCRAGLLR